MTCQRVRFKRNQKTHSTLLEKGEMPMDDAEYSSTGCDTSDMEMTNFTFDDEPSIKLENWPQARKALILAVAVNLVAIAPTACRLPLGSFTLLSRILDSMMATRGKLSGLHLPRQLSDWQDYSRTIEWQLRQESSQPRHNIWLHDVDNGMYFCTELGRVCLKII
ncbi:uncharacterized protein K444DRAFT_627374 [Hyaloscypha bicolor E]|uniref:Uncharacterized protein n=1 Tax=Hyaloscypha bicolor E TaxID=1095630 RepID=A0A2J6THH0_9HELO|nr:uncharacterized protein K444DRAFT_627374 [Hyaloscypha bicolor E]PMD62441.1 hypothetical protein K444DRAFT_627374 [Hyaloscypha bicolor E]